MHYNSVLLIPAYKPDEKLTSLIANIKRNDRYLDIIIVDDGSSDEYRDIFAELKEHGCTILTHDINMGKGQALKTGLKYCIEEHLRNNDFTGVVTADADGQHTVEDIRKIAEGLETQKDKLIIGTRVFDSSTPLRSRIGNNITAFIYKIISGVKINDTQTGLRGLPSNYLDKMLNIKGSRYEYEMNVLLSLGKMKLGVYEVPIETIYIEENKSSHFNPLLDSIRIYSKILKFLLSSILSIVIDYAIYTSLLLFDVIGTSQAFIAGKAVSSIFNFIFNKRFVFKSKSTGSVILKEAFKYYLLVAVNILLGTLFNNLLINLGISKYFSKPICDIVLFVLNYFVQKTFVFQE